MTKIKHTPGPWYHMQTYANRWKILPNPTGPQCIAHVSFQNGETWAGKQRVDKANARLIAAAPELLEAVEYLLEDYINAMELHDWDREGLLKTEEVERVLTVIAKAKGESYETAQ